MDEDDNINEVLNIQQREKRKQIMRRYEPRIQRARELAKKKMAPESTIHKRAFVKARQIVRKRVAGERGAEYEKLGPSEKMAIDRAVEAKQKMIKKIALRLIPKLKQAESKRLSSFIHGQSIQNQGAPEGHHTVKEDINQLFAENFPPYNTSNALGQNVAAPVASGDVTKKKTDKKTNNNNIIQYGKFQEELQNDTPVFASLYKKSEKSGIDLEIIGEVFDRGWNAWTEETGVSQQQYAFARVNSYINQGKTYFNEDADLHEREALDPGEDAETKIGRKMAVSHLMGALNDREKHVITRIYKHGHTRDSIAKDLNLSNSRVTNIEAKALRKMKDHSRKAGIRAHEYREEVQQTNENFMDGKGPGKPGDAARHGLKGKSASELRKIRSSETASPRKKQLAHWMLNMHHNESVEEANVSKYNIPMARPKVNKAPTRTFGSVLDEVDVPAKHLDRARSVWNRTKDIEAVKKYVSSIKEDLKDPEDNPCWKGYKPVGTKKLRGKTVPNCVPESVEKVAGTNCKNCVFWREDLTRPVSKDELNENGGLKATSKEYLKMSKEVDLVTLPGKGTVREKGFCDNTKVMEWVTERMCCALWDGEGTKREYKGDATFMEQDDTMNGTKLVNKVAKNSKARANIEKVDRAAPHVELGKQAEIQRKIIEDHPNCGTPECCGQCTPIDEKLGNVENKPSKRLQGTDSLVTAYKKDTPGEKKSLDESFNIAYAAGIGVTLTARDLGMQTQGSFTYHPSVVEEMNRRAQEVEEEVTSADVKGEVIPAHTKIVTKPDGSIEKVTVPGHVRRGKVNRKIIRSGSVTDGEPPQ